MTNVRFLFTVWPYAGHLHPCLALAARLAGRGHSVAFCSAASAGATVRQAGHDFFPFQQTAAYLGGLVGRQPDDPGIFHALNERYTTIGESSLAGKLSRVRALLSEMTAGSVAAQYADLRTVAASWRPDLVLTDPMVWAPLVLWGESTGTPVVPFSFYAGCLTPGRRLPLAGLGVAPARGAVGVLRNRAINTAISWVNAPVRAQVNRLRAVHGLAPIADSVPAHSGRFPLYLSAGSAEYDFARDDLPPGARYVGPCLWESSAPPAAALGLRDGAPLVYVSEGTAQVGEPFLIRAAVAALAGRPDLDIVITTGKQRTVASLGLGHLPPHIRAVEWVSHRDVFGRASVVVTTGGSGTTRQALACGVPVLAVPLEWDQLENAARLEACGAGTRLARRHCTSSAVGRAVATLMDEPGYRRQASRIATGFAKAESDPEPLDRLEEAAAAARSGRRSA